MFGYITVDKPELKVREYETYRAHYCGLCHCLRERYGIAGQVTLSYDMTFLAILLDSVYGIRSIRDHRRCVVHPLRGRDMLASESSAYAADMNLVLTWYHLADDWRDEKKKSALAGVRLLRRAYLSVEKRYPQKCRTIRACLKELTRMEREKETSIDRVSGCFGRLLGEIFAWREDIWREDLYQTGFYLGKYIYLLDAYDDIIEDQKKGNYNPLLRLYGSESYEEICERLLLLMMAECTGHFERLPCVGDVEILRNVLYAGVWNAYHRHREKMKKEETVYQNDQ